MNTPLGLFGSGPNAHPSYKANSSKAFYPRDKANGQRVPADNSECCVYCGKFVGFGPLAVFLADDGTPSDPADLKNKIDCLGFYPIGSDCAKKARKAGITVYELNTETKVYETPNK